MENWNYLAKTDLGDLWVKLRTPRGELPRLIPRPLADCVDCGGRGTIGIHEWTWQCRECNAVGIHVGGVSRGKD